MNSLLSTLLLLSALFTMASTLDVRTDSSAKIYDEMTKDLNEAKNEITNSVSKQFPGFKIGRSYPDVVEDSDGIFKDDSPELRKAFEEFNKKYHKNGHSFTTTENSFSEKSNCTSEAINANKDSSCEISATWNSAENGDCFKSTYYKRAYLPGSANASNGVEKCTKTLCGATEPTTTDCKEAFGSKFSAIPSVKF